nr:MAG: hypothetical protein DIU68_19435 [Chloroflexota bacterium]
MTNGLSLLDLTELPAPWRTVMTVALRETCISFDDLVQAVGTLPASQQINEGELRQIVEALSARGYLVEDTAANGRVYRPRVTRRSGRKMSEKLWCALEDTASDSARESSDPPAQRPARKSLWDSLV